MLRYLELRVVLLTEFKGNWLFIVNNYIIIIITINVIIIINFNNSVYYFLYRIDIKFDTY